MESSLVSPGTCCGQPEGTGEPTVLPPGSWAVSLHYTDTGFLCRDGHPSLHPGSAAPQRALTALPHFRAVPPPHPTASHLRHPCPQGPGPAINQPGLPLPHPFATAPPEQPGCRIFPVHPPLPLAERWIRTWSPDVVPVRGTQDGAWAEREWLGTVRGTGHGGSEAPLCRHLLGCRGTSWLWPRHPRAG